MNIPNKLTLTRLILFIPLFFLLGTLASLNLKEAIETINYSNFNNWQVWVWISAGVIFCLCVLTDYFDGKIARKTKQITVFGKVFDPLADKIVINFCFIIFSRLGFVPWFITALFIIRDVLVDGLRSLVVKEKINIPANFLGKAKTILQMIAIFVIFCAVPAMDTNTLLDKTFFLLSPFSKDAWIARLWALHINTILALILSLASMVWYYKINWRSLIESFSKTKLEAKTQEQEEDDVLDLGEENFENQEEVLEVKEEVESIENKEDQQKEEILVDPLVELSSSDKTLEPKTVTKKQTKVVKKTTIEKSKKTSSTKNKKPLSEQKIDEILEPDEKKPWE
ncbi:MAG: CDP-diacylglycerol--glycerol-3-phosphate 3-phosphatidyltransferase [Mycoplasma sp.]|nr:CDP-diacylglycerol--glycerol-3-phosphate 3-phosphatidyltransferase [Mycoplasma sp.]